VPQSTPSTFYSVQNFILAFLRQLCAPQLYQLLCAHYLPPPVFHFQLDISISTSHLPSMSIRSRTPRISLKSRFQVGGPPRYEFATHRIFYPHSPHFLSIHLRPRPRFESTVASMPRFSSSSPVTEDGHIFSWEEMMSTAPLYAPNYPFWSNHAQPAVSELFLTLTCVSHL